MLSASLLLVVMDMTVLNTALPAISADLRPDSVQLLWMVDAYSLVLAGLPVTVSALGDRWGRKKMLLTGFAIFGLASLAVLAAIALTWFVRRCLRRPDPILEVRLFRSPVFTAGVLTALSASIAMVAMMLLEAQWLQLVQGYSPLQAGFALLPTAVGAGVATPLAPGLANRVGVRPVLSGGLAVCGLGMLVLFLAPEPLTYGMVALALLLIGVGMGSLAVASVVIMAGSPAQKAGSAAAIEETSYELGGVLGVAVLGSIAAAVYRAGLPDAPAAARESLGGAVEVARAGGGGPGLIAEAQRAFTDSLSWFGLAGAALLLGTALVVAWLTPRDLDIAAAEH